MSTSQASRAPLSKQLAEQKYDPMPPEVPTEAMPGTDEKMRILIERAQSGKGLWHPDDRRWSDVVEEMPKKNPSDQFAFALTLADLFES